MSDKQNIAKALIQFLGDSYGSHTDEPYYDVHRAIGILEFYRNWSDKEKGTKEEITDLDGAIRALKTLEERILSENPVLCPSCRKTSTFKLFSVGRAIELECSACSDRFSPDQLGKD